MKQFTFLAFFLLCSIPMFALRFEGGDEVRIDEDIHEDIYVAGGTVHINGKVFGDVIAMGGEVILEDSIIGDVIAGGGKVYINGWVGDDVRVAGGALSIRQGVHGDVIITGGDIQIDRTAQIDGDLIAASGDIQVDGDIQGNIRIAAGKFALDGTVGGRASVRGGDFYMNGRINGPSEISVEELKVRSDAWFGSTVRYWTEQGEVDFGSSLGSGATAVFDADLEHEKSAVNISAKEKESFWGKGIFGMLWYIVSMGFLAALLHFLFGKKLRQAAGLSEGQSFEMLLRGLVFFVLTPIIAIMLLVTVLGIPIGLVVGGMYILLASISKVVTATVGAQWLNVRQDANWKIPMLGLVSAAILLVLKGISAIPFLGWLASFALVCVVYGALYTLFRQKA